MGRQAKKIEQPKNESEVPRLAEVLRCHIRQTVDRTSEAVGRLRETADKAQQAHTHFRIVKVTR